MKKRVWSILLALVMVLGLLPAAAFAAGLPFTDVPANAWYYNDVKNAVASGLVNGKTGTTYAPNDNLTYAEAVKLAACMYQKSYEGIVTLKNGSPWYQSYVDYAYLNGIITRDYDWNAKATRAGYMDIFACALTADDLAPMNQVADDAIPDVRMTHPQAAAIYSLYRAGILQGGDAIGSCKPNDNIKRSEVAAILTRMMDPAKRVSFQLGEAGALTISAQPRALVLDNENHDGSLTVTVSGGKAPYTYQWYREDGSKVTDYSGLDHAGILFPTSAALTFENAHCEGGALLAGTYYCIVKDADGKSVTSNMAMVSVSANDLIVNVERAYIALADKETAFTATAIAAGGAGSYRYSWYFGDDKGMFTEIITYQPNFPQTASVTVKPDPRYNTQYMKCKVTDKAGAEAFSPTIAIDVLASELSVINQPQSRSIRAGETAKLSISVSGGKAPYTYEWQKKEDGKFNFTVGTTATVDVKPTANTTYRCFVTDAAGNHVYSDEATVTVGANDLTVNVEKDNINLKNFDSVFTATAIAAGGAGSYQYSWYWGDDKGRFTEIITYQPNFPQTASVTVKPDSRYNTQYMKCKVTDKAGAEKFSPAIKITVSN